MGSLVGTLVTIYGGSSPSVVRISELSPSTSPRIGYLASPETASATLGGVSITSVSWVSVPPPPRERFVFYGTGSNLDASGVRDGETTYDSIFVIARPAGASISSAQEWMVSPPARLIGNNKWVIYWTMDRPPANVAWTAVSVSSPEPVIAQYQITIGPSGKRMITPYVPPGYWQGYEEVLKKYGLTGTVRQMYPYVITDISRPWPGRR